MQGSAEERQPIFDVRVWRWVRAALASGALASFGGIVLGAATGFVSGPVVGLVGTVVFFLGWSAWQIGRIGGAALGAGFLGFFACLGCGIELPRAWRLAHAPVQRVRSVQEWPASDASSILVAEETTLASDRPPGEAAALVDRASGIVVGFACGVVQAKGRGAGEWFVPTALWGGDARPECMDSAWSASERLRAAQRPVDAIAAQRVYERFEGEGAFRRATDTPAVVRVVPGLFALYAILVVALRRRGADSVDAP
jgi:hypothetical protein